MKLSAYVTLILLSLSVKAFSQGGACSLQVTPSVVGTSCSNICDGSVTFITTGGTPPYTLNSFEHNFPGTQVDASTFRVNNGNYQVSNNTLIALPNGSISTDLDNAISTKKTFPANGKIVAEASFYVDNSTFGYWGLSDTTNIFNEFQFPISFYFNNGSLLTYNNGASTQVSNYSSNTWYDFKIEKIGSLVNFYIRRTGLSNYTLITSQQTTVSETFFKLSATYRNYYSTFGGFQSKNWKIGGNPPNVNLCSGTYTYTVYDAVGCFASSTVTITSGTGPSSVKLTGSVTPASCFTAANGAVALAPTGGVGPYSFGLSQNFQGNVINTQVFELRNGSFSQNVNLREGIDNSVNTGWDNSIATRQTFSDGGFLSFEGSFKMDPTADVVFGFAKNDSLNDPNKVLLGFRFGAGSTLYAFTGNSTLKQVATLAASNWYDFKIQKVGYVVTFSYRLTGATAYTDLYTINYTPNIVEYKFGVLNYSNFSASSGGYNTKDWSILVTPKVSRLTPGMYTYTLTDAAGCSATSVFNVGEATSSVSLTANLVNGSIYNGATGAVSITPAGGTAPYKYQFEEPFADSVINTGFLTVRNGAFLETTSLRSGSGTGNITWDNTITTNLVFNDNGYITATGSFKLDAGTIGGFGMVTNSSVTSDISQLVFGVRFNGTQILAVNGRNRTTVIGTIASDTWYDLKITKTASSIEYYIKASSSSNYTLLSTLTYADTLKVFKGALLVFGSNAGLNTKDWTINSNPPLTGLASATYNFRVYDAKGCYADASVNVPSVGSPMPNVTAPANVIKPTDSGSNFASNVNIGWPTLTGDTTSIIVTNNAPTKFSLGTTNVVWSITNRWGRTVTTTQTVTIIDTEAPIITSSGRTTYSTDKGQPYAVVNLVAPSMSDNVGVVTITNNAPAQFPLGTTTVTWIVKDAAGNTSTKSQDILIIDTELPNITAPANITVLANSGSYATGVNLGTPIYSDNVIVVTVSNDAPSQFPVGSTTVTWRATDAAGNTATATQIVTVTNCNGYNVTVTSILGLGSVFTGGNSNNLYLGYGAQSTQLKVTVPVTGGPYTFSWIGSNLSSKTSAIPTFTPTAAGSYTFYVTATNANGCESSGSITICVKDARVLNSNGNWDGKKVYVCHLPPGNKPNMQLISVSVNAVDTHVGLHEGDAVGKCGETCNSFASRSSVPATEAFSVKAYPNPSADFFRLQVKTEDVYTRITVRIVDAFGRTVEMFNNVTADKLLQFGDKYSSGAYYAEVTQGEERKMIPLMKAK